MKHFYDVTKRAIPVKQIFIKNVSGYHKEVVFKFRKNLYVLFHIKEKTDELLHEVIYSHPEENYIDAIIEYPYLEKVIGKIIMFAWVMRDSRGFIDTFQLQFPSVDNQDVTIQIKIVESSFTFYRMMPRTPLYCLI